MPYESLKGRVSTRIYRIRKNFQISQLWYIIEVNNLPCFGRGDGLTWEKGQGPFLIMGAGPHTPLLGMINGIVREWILCGGQRMGEHALSDKLASNDVCGNNRFHSPSIRV